MGEQSSGAMGKTRARRPCTEARKGANSDVFQGPTMFPGNVFSSRPGHAGFFFCIWYVYGAGEVSVWAWSPVLVRVGTRVLFWQLWGLPWAWSQPQCQPRIRCSLITRKMLVTGLLRSPSHLYLETLTPLMRLLSSSFYFARVGRPKHLIFDCMSSLLLILTSFFFGTASQLSSLSAAMCASTHRPSLPLLAAPLFSAASISRTCQPRDRASGAKRATSEGNIFSWRWTLQVQKFLMANLSVSWLT